MHDKKEYVVHIRSLKQALTYGLVFKKVQRVIKFNQKAWLKSYLAINTKIIKRQKLIAIKGFFKLMNHAVSENTIDWCQNKTIILQSVSQKICWQYK